MANDMQIEELIARDVVPGVDPVTDGKALGRAVLECLKFGADRVVVDVDGLRLGTLSSSFFNMVADVVLRAKRDTTLNDVVEWRSQNPVVMDLVLYWTAP